MDMSLDKQENLKKWLLGRFDQLKEIRMRGENERWAAYSMMDFRTDVDSDSKFIKKRHLAETDHIYAWDVFVNGIMANLCSPNVQWFKLTMRGENGEQSDDIPGANDWMEDSEQRLMQHFNDGHFYPEAKMAIQDASCGGTSFEMIVDDARNNRIVHDCVDPQECYIDEDASHVVDTFFRDFKMTALQAVGKFGDETPEKVRQLYENNDTKTQCEFLQAIFPVAMLPKEYRNAIPSRIKRFASVWYSFSDTQVFHIGGFNFFPVAVHRYMRNDRSPYGQGVIMRIMPDLLEYQHLVERYNYAVDMLSNPPLFSPSSLKGKFDYRPGAINYTNNMNGGAPTPINVTLDINALSKRLEDIRTQIRQKLYNDLFEMVSVDDIQRTKYEVSRIEGRRLMLLSAIIGNIQVEKLNPIVEDTLGIMILRKDTLPIPEAVAKKVLSSPTTGVHIELNGLLSQNLRAYQQTIGLEDGLSAIATMMQIYPNCSVNFDFDKIARKYATSKLLPQDCILEMPKVNEIKKQMAAQNQQQQQQQQMLEAAKAAKDLSGVDMGNLQAMMGTGGGTQAQSASMGGNRGL